MKPAFFTLAFCEGAEPEWGIDGTWDLEQEAVNADLVGRLQLVEAKWRLLDWLWKNGFKVFPGGLDSCAFCIASYSCDFCMVMSVFGKQCAALDFYLKAVNRHEAWPVLQAIHELWMSFE